ncbi:MAG: VWA domain-containing protein [Flavobacteriaceae bacterium]|nr:VWA domain-containing protein [Flavobacteriaceae bacterium]
MQTLNVLLILLAFIAALLLVYYQYFYKVKRYKNIYVLALLRFLAVFGIFMLLINPTFKQKHYTLLKPKLYVNVDNSASIGFAKQDTTVLNLVKKIRTHKTLNEKFDINYFSFGETLRSSSEFNFQENQTNIYQSLDALNKISNEKISPIIFISDGNQTYGNDYKYFISKQPIYSIVVGDTTHFSDLEISRVNVNTFSYLDNKFPVEVFINYEGIKKIKSKFVVEENGQIIYSQTIQFSSDKKGEHLAFKLPANKIGKHLYQTKIQPFSKERNTINNIKNFSIDIIDEKTQIAIVYDVLHPDIGMVKRVIESNPKRNVVLMDLNTSVHYDMDSDVFVLYQPNSKFDEVFKWIKSKKKNYFIITGNQTDWNFLNNIQNDFKRVTSFDTQSYSAKYNNAFSTFYAEDIGFEDFSPIEDAFGKIDISVAYQTLLFQNINGVQLQDPLLISISNNSERRVVLFGENIWKWRALSYSFTQSFEKFNQFFNGLIQYLTISKNNNTIDLDFDPFYYANDVIKIKAKSYDDNLNFDKNANLELFLNDDNNGIPFYLNGFDYEVQLPELKSGDYSFKVINSQNSNQITGAFTVAKYAVEHEILSANVSGLKTVAKNSKGLWYFPKEIDELINLLIENQSFTSIQKENKKIISLIDWWWYLSVIILSLSLEWFIRKYRGLI